MSKKKLITVAAVKNQYKIFPLPPLPLPKRNVLLQAFMLV